MKIITLLALVYFTFLPHFSRAETDSIALLVSHLSASPLWENGIFPTLKLPAGATIETVVAECLHSTGFDAGHIKSYQIIKKEDVTIPAVGGKNYTAVLIESDLGRKIVLLTYLGTDLGWWSRVFDAAKIEKLSDLNREPYRLRLPAAVTEKPGLDYADRRL